MTTRISTQYTTTDGLTGEILTSQQHTLKIERLQKEPPFVKMYINDIGLWEGLSGGETSILYFVSSAVDYDGVVSVSPYLKGKIKAQLKVSDGFIRNTLVKLTAKHILIKSTEYTGVYKLNPYWFGKGDWKDIIEQRKAFVIQITKAYGMEIPRDINPVSFLTVKESINKTEQEKLEAAGQQRLDV